MKNFKSNRFNNKNKYFYEDKLIEKNKKLRAILILYLFNNLDDFKNLMNILIEENKEKMLRFNDFIYFHTYSVRKPYIDINLEIEKFLNSLKDKFPLSKYNLSLAKSIITPFGFEESLNDFEKKFIDFILKELKENSFFLNDFTKNLDSDIFFDLCLRYPNLKKYCPKNLKEELNLVIDILKNN